MEKYYYYTAFVNGGFIAGSIKAIGSFPISEVLQDYASQGMEAMVMSYFEISQEEAEKLNHFYEYRESVKGTKS